MSSVKRLGFTGKDDRKLRTKLGKYKNCSTHLKQIGLHARHRPQSTFKPVQRVHGSACMLSIQQLMANAPKQVVVAPTPSERVKADIEAGKLRLVKLVNKIEINAQKAHISTIRESKIQADKAAKHAERFGKVCDPPRDYGLWHVKSISHGVKKGYDLREIVTMVDSSKPCFGGANRRPVKVDNLSNLVYIVLWNGSRNADLVEHDFLAAYYGTVLHEFLVARGAKVVRPQSRRQPTGRKA